MPTILIVDDDDSIRSVLYDFLSEKYECHTASTAEQAIEFLEVENYDAVLTDIAMPGLDGVSLLKQVQLRDSTTPVILISGKSREHIDHLLELGAFGFIGKPFHLDEVERAVDRAVTKKQASK